VTDLAGETMLPGGGAVTVLSRSAVSPSWPDANAPKWYGHYPAVVVIGGSAGAIAALRVLASQLPLGFPTPILVALHWPPQTRGAHHMIGGRLPVAQASDGEPLRPGCIALARPDWHLLVEEGRLRLVQSRLEHHFRPAIDPLFRSAARAYGPRVVGVLLSGRNADGTAGLLNIVLRGGVAIVQDPDEAEHAAMPQSAIDNVPNARRMPLADIARALVALAEGGRPLDDPGYWPAGAPPVSAATPQPRVLPRKLIRASGGGAYG
jgi:two-component system chemotaxis response regulator CheB